MTTQFEEPGSSWGTVPTAAGLLGVDDPAAGADAIAQGSTGQSRQRLTYAYMALARGFDLRFESLRLAGRLAKWYSAIGHEAVTVPSGMMLRPGDALCTLHRDLGAILAHYLDPAVAFPSLEVDLVPRTDWPDGATLLRRLACQLLGKAGGFSEGIERSFHYGFFASGDRLRHIGMISHLGSMIPVAAGCAFYLKQQGQGGLAINFIGDGGTSTGDFHEALNFAAVWQLPLVMVIENNQYAFSTPTSDQYAAKQLSDRALGYGMPGETVDGNDPDAVAAAIDRASRRARSGGGPTLIEAIVGRMRGHAEGDDSLKVVPERDLHAYLEADPVPAYRKHLLDEGVLDDAGMERLSREIDEMVEDAVEFALAAPLPETSVAHRPVFATAANPTPQAHGKALRIERSSLPPETSYVDAIREALFDAMRSDERIYVMGQDIGAFEGPFRTTRGLHERWPDRVLDTPIAESGTVGLAVGAALLGHVPVLEMQFADFVSCGFNQIVNVAAKLMYRFERPCPLVIRLPSGGGVGAGAFHSQNPEAWFAHVAGLKVVCPATAEDAYHLLCDAIEDPNPVIFCEHKFLYRRARTAPGETTVLPLGRAALRREGTDISLIAYGSSVPLCLEAAESLATQGIEADVVDLRSLIPLDEEAILASVRRTGRALMVHEAPGTGGFGAEVVARITDRAFSWLDAPVRRVTYPDLPVPFVKALERELLPSVEKVVRAALELAAF
jgi:2-oxoisovalerate dehydrogenase E1 component